MLQQYKIDLEGKIFYDIECKKLRKVVLVELNSDRFKEKKTANTYCGVIVYVVSDDESNFNESVSVLKNDKDFLRSTQ